MLKKQLIILLFLFQSTISICQENIDMVLSSFEEALKASEENYQDTFRVYLESYGELLTLCENKYLFYKTYSKFHYDAYRDDIVLSLQKDSILTLQRQCLPDRDDEITTTLVNIARSYYYLSRYNGEDLMDLAESYFLEVSHRQAESDQETERYAKRYVEIAEFYNYRQDYKKAALYFERASNIYSGDRNSREYLEILLGNGRCLIREQKYNEAVEVLAESIERYKKKPGDFQVELSYAKLAVAYRALDQLDQAEDAIVHARKLSSMRSGSLSLSNDIIFASRHGAILKSQRKFDESYRVYMEVKEFIKEMGEEVTIDDVSGLNEDLADLFYEKGNYQKALELYHKGIAELVVHSPADFFANPDITTNEIFYPHYLHRQLGLKARAHLALAQESHAEENYTAALDAILKYDTLGRELLTENWEEDSHQQRIRALSPFYLIGLQSAIRLYECTGDKEFLHIGHNISSRYKGQLLHRGISLKNRRKEMLNDSLRKMEKQLQSNINSYEKSYLQALIGDSHAKEHLRKYVDEKTKLDKFYLDHDVLGEMRLLAPSDTPSLSEIQFLLGAEEGLLEYFISEDSIYSFLLTKEGINHSIDHYDRQHINQYRDWLINEKSMLNDVELSNVLLDLLDKETPNGVRKLVIIPDGQLLQIPFETLKWKEQFLLEHFDISYQYSTSFLVHEKKKSAKRSYLGFASDYSFKDLIGEPDLTLLPYAIEEIKTTQALLGGNTFINSRASKSNFSAYVEQSDILHLALHSRINSTYPDQSALVFQSDTTYEYLTASEIYNLDLTADLTVLSACNTAVGEINRGDGVRSITRSFIHAGSSSVLTTLWEAPDVSTSKIINGFYQELKRGSSKDEALRKAKLEYIGNSVPSYQHPRYWAHLVLVGDTAPLDISGKILYIIMGIGLSIAIIVFLITLRSRRHSELYS